MAAALGDIFYRAVSLVTRLAGNTTATRKFLRQVGTGAASAAPAWDQVADADLSVTDITTNNVSTAAHGFAPKAPGDATKFLNGANPPAYTTPAGSGNVNASGTLTANQLVIGAGSTDVAVTTTGTGILTALGINVGSAGAPVTFNGAGGTPSSLTLTNATALPLTTGVTGILPIANGGTGVAKLPRVLVFNSTTQTVNNNTDTTLTFDSETYDTDTMHTSGGTSSRITFTTAGAYHVSSYMLFASNAAGYRVHVVLLNGTTAIGKDFRTGVTTDESGSTVSFDYLFAAGDYIEMHSYQQSGSNLAVTARFSAHILP